MRGASSAAGSAKPGEVIAHLACPHTRLAQGMIFVFDIRAVASTPPAAIMWAGGMVGHRRRAVPKDADVGDEAFGGGGDGEYRLRVRLEQRS